MIVEIHKRDGKFWVFYNERLVGIFETEDAALCCAREIIEAYRNDR